MSNGHDKLNKIGAQKIHEKTHIARIHVQAILHNSFEGMNKVQFIGFISILEREYNISLDELKQSGLDYFSEEEPQEDENEDHKVFVTPKKKKSFKTTYLIIAIMIFFSAIYFNSINKHSDSNSTTQNIDNIAIENAKSNIEVSNEVNISLTDVNLSEEQIAEPEPEIIKSFKIIPSTEIWVGYIDLKTYKKYQKLFSDELVLDPTTDWLLHLGHGYVTIEIDGNATKYTNKLNMRFVYRDGEIKKINFDEFKSLNRGNKW